MTTPEALTAKLELAVDPTGDGIEDFLVAGETVTLFPANGNSANFTVTLTYSDRRPAPGIAVSCAVTAQTLTQAEWRTPQSLASRFGGSSGKILERISQGVIRLGVRPTPTVQNTDQNGRATFRLDAFHVAGNEGNPASDRVIFSWNGGSTFGIVRSAVEGLVALADNPAGGLTTAGLVGRHVHPQILQVLQAIGSAWQRVTDKPAGMPNYITVTGASMRWGGLNPPHMTHRFGGTVDVRPIATDGGATSVGAPNYHRRGTEIIIDFMRQTGATEIRFADNLPGVTAVDASHRDHVHVSWLRQPSEPWLTIVAQAPSFAEVPALT